MKMVKLLAACSLALLPAVAGAQSTTAPAADQGTVTPGGTAQGPLPVFGLGAIPAGAVVVGGVVIVAGAVVGVVAASDRGNESVATSTSTN